MTLLSLNFHTKPQWKGTDQAEGNIILSDFKSLLNAHLNGFVLTLGKSINA